MDNFKIALTAQCGCAGLRCPCCNPNKASKRGRKTRARARMNRAARAVVARATAREIRDAQD